jgi:hypothetical protein
MIDIDDLNDEEDIEDEIGDQYADTLLETPEAEESITDWMLDKLSFLAGLPATFSCMSFAGKNNYIPDVRWKAILFFLAIFICSILIIRGFLSLYKYLVTILFFIAVCWLGINSIRGKGYGFKALKDDYVEVVMNIVSNKGK